MMENKKKIENKMDISELADGRGIYAIQHIASSKVYIGQSGTIRKRISSHLAALKKGRHINSKLQNAFNKYGADSFKAITLEIVSEGNLNIKEDYWATKYDSFKHGYNISSIIKDSEPWYMTDTQIAKHKGFKLKKKDVIEICHLLNNGETNKSIAKKFNVLSTAISDIRTGKTWRKTTDGIWEIDRTNTFRILTEDEVNKVCTLLNDKISVIEISKRLKISENIIRHIKRGDTYVDYSKKILLKEAMSESRYKLSEQEIIDICHMINDGVSINDIHKKYDKVNNTYIVRIINGERRGDVSSKILNPEFIDSRKSQLSYNAVIDICEMLNKGHKITEVAKKHKVTNQTIYDIVDGKSWANISKNILVFQKKKKRANLSESTVKDICHMLNKGFTVKEVSEKYDASIYTIYNIIKGKTWHNISKGILNSEINKEIPVLDAEKVEKICYLILDGLTVDEIAEKLGLKPRLIRNIKNRETWKEITVPLLKSLKSRTRLTEENFIEVCNLINKGFPLIEIAKEYNVSLSYLSKVKHKITYTDISKNAIKKEDKTKPKKMITEPLKISL